MSQVAEGEGGGMEQLVVKTSGAAGTCISRLVGACMVASGTAAGKKKHVACCRVDVMHGTPRSSLRLGALRALVPMAKNPLETSRSLFELFRPGVAVVVESFMRAALSCGMKQPVCAAVCMYGERHRI